MEKIINSDYISIEALVENADNYAYEEIRSFLENIIEEWSTNNISLATMTATLKFVHIYLDQSKLKFNFKNRISIPICYFSSFLLLGAIFLYSYLKNLSFKVALFPLNKTDRHLKKFIENKKPSMIICTLSQFLHIEALKKIIPYLHNNNLKIFIGGISFVYDKDLKKKFADCLFPKNINELTQLLENYTEKG